MPELRPITAVTYAPGRGPTDLSARLAPPYDVLDEAQKRQLLGRDPHNIVAIDLPHTPPKVVGPDAVYEQAGRTFRGWLEQQVLRRGCRPVLYAYQQTFTHAGVPRRRRGLIGGLRLQDFGTAPGAAGGVWAHELTFSSGKEDRLKLTRACQAQLSPVFGMFEDAGQRVGRRLAAAIAAGAPTFLGRTANDGVLHEVWEIADERAIADCVDALAPADVFIADGHHRYHTALSYRDELAAGADLPPNHPARFCLFVLVAIDDPGLLVLPTHRVVWGLRDLSWPVLAEAADGRLSITPFAGADLGALEEALPRAGPQAVGLYLPAEASGPLAIATPTGPDPLLRQHADKPPAWRRLGVAIVQHLVIEEVCRGRLTRAGGKVGWAFPHTLEQLASEARQSPGRLGLVLQPTPLRAVMEISRAGALMPQKSTFFYPKLATGLVIHSLEPAGG